MQNAARNRSRPAVATRAANLRGRNPVTNRPLPRLPPNLMEEVFMSKSRASCVVALAFVVLGIGIVNARPQGDGSVKKASNTALQNGGAPKAVIGTIDMEAVWRDYEKAKFQREQLKAEGMAKQGSLNQIIAEATQVRKEMEGFAPGSPDFKLRESKLTELKAKLQAEQEKAQREFDAKEAEILSTFYREAQQMVAAVAKKLGMNFVVKVSNEPISGQNPEAVMMAMAKSVVYSDDSVDITDWVVHNLNTNYVQKGGKTVAPAAASATPTGGNTQGNVAPRPR
jgi:outer membrane protein